MELTTLLIPIATVLGLFGYAIITDPLSVHIASVNVTQSMADSGRTEDYVDEMLKVEIERLESTGCSRVRPRPFQAQSEKSAVRLAAEAIDADEAMRAVQRIFGQFGGLVDLYFVEEGDKELRAIAIAAGAKRKQAMLEVRGSRDRFDPILEEMARSIVQHFDPYTLLLAQYRAAVPTGDFTTLRNKVENVSRRLVELPPEETPAEAVWISNLAGMIDFMTGRREAAIGHFSQAIEQAPNHCVPHLNLATILVQDGRYAEAIPYLDACLKPGMDRVPVMEAAVHAERGVAHDGLGDNRAAEADFTAAATIHPKGSWIYQYWAEFHERNGNPMAADELRRHAKTLVGKDNVYTEMLLESVRLRDGIPDGPDCE